MGPIRCSIATNQRELDDALRVRWQVFGGELGLLSTQVPFVEREVDGFDTLETTLHFVAYAAQEPIATARLLFPNREVARASGFRVGIDLESKFELGRLGAVAPAEVTRLCVRRAWRGSPALAQLDALMRRESRARGVTHWVAAANAETTSIEDAQIAYRLAAWLGFVSRRWHVEPKIHAAPDDVPHCPLYTPEERRRAHEGDLTGLELPHTLTLFARKLGARYVGEPIYDARFRRCSMPLVASLASSPTAVTRAIQCAISP